MGSLLDGPTGRWLTCNISHMLCASHSLGMRARVATNALPQAANGFVKSARPENIENTLMIGMSNIARRSTSVFSTLTACVCQRLWPRQHSLSARTLL